MWIFICIISIYLSNKVGDCLMSKKDLSIDLPTIKEEYKMLRDEIMHHKKRQNTFTVFSYTTAVTLWGVAIDTKSPWITIIPLVIMFVTSLRVFDSRQSIARISSYIQVFIEQNIDYKWESRLHKYREHKYFRENFIYFASKCDFILIALSSSVLFWLLVYWEEKNIKPAMFWFTLAIQVIVILTEIILTLYCYDYERLIKTKSKKWRETEESLIKRQKKCNYCPCRNSSHKKGK